MRALRVQLGSAAPHASVMEQQTCRSQTPVGREARASANLAGGTKTTPPKLRQESNGLLSRRTQVQIRAGGTTIPWKLIWMQQATLNRKAAGSAPARGTIPS